MLLAIISGMIAQFILAIQVISGLLEVFIRYFCRGFYQIFLNIYRGFYQIFLK